MRHRILGMLFLMCSPVLATDQQWTWLLTDNPPSTIMQGDQLVAGLIKPKLDVLRALLTGYQHQTQLVSLARLHKALSSGEPACSFLMKTPEREKTMLFSPPAMVAYTHYAVLRSDAFVQIGQPSQIAVAQLLRRQLRGVMQKNRSYGAQLDQQLTALQSEALHNEGLLRDVVQPDDTVLQLLLKNRADFTFNYPVLINYWKKQHPDVAAQISITRLSGQAEFDLAYIACGNSDWGQRAITAINGILDQALRDTKYQSADDVYLDPPMQQAFHRFYVEHLLNKRR